MWWRAPTGTRRDEYIWKEAFSLCHVFTGLLKVESVWVCGAGTHYPEHPHQRWMSGGVKGRVVVRRGAVVIPRLVALGVERCSLGIECADRLQKNRGKYCGLSHGHMQMDRANCLLFMKTVSAWTINLKQYGKITALPTADELFLFLCLSQ